MVRPAVYTRCRQHPSGKKGDSRNRPRRFEFEHRILRSRTNAINSVPIGRNHLTAGSCAQHAVDADGLYRSKGRRTHADRLLKEMDGPIRKQEVRTARVKAAEPKLAERADIRSRPVSQSDVCHHPIPCPVKVLWLATYNAALILGRAGHGLGACRRRVGRVEGRKESLGPRPTVENIVRVVHKSTKLTHGNRVARPVGDRRDPGRKVTAKYAVWENIRPVTACSGWCRPRDNCTTNRIRRDCRRRRRKSTESKSSLSR